MWMLFCITIYNKIERVQKIAVSRGTDKNKLWRMERNKKGVV